MISAARVAALAATAGATVLMAGARLEPAMAQGDACKAELVTATGRGKFRPFTKTRELEGRGSAMKDAVATWEREVASTHGERWKLWSEAKDKTFECAPTKPGKVIGSSFIGCTISGRPCAAPKASAVEPGSAVVAEARTGSARESPVRGRRSWRYRREMARQEALARWRERREERAWEREEARQRYLQRTRDRAETAGWARANARERYLARERD